MMFTSIITHVPVIFYMYKFYYCRMYQLYFIFTSNILMVCIKYIIYLLVLFLLYVQVVSVITVVCYELYFMYLLVVYLHLSLINKDTDFVYKTAFINTSVCINTTKCH